MKTYSKITQPIANTLGYNYDSLNDEELVTVVRRKVILEETVITKKEFNDLNNEVESDDDGFYWSHLEWEDAKCPDYNEEQTVYTAFPGDVTSFTDDCVAFAFTDIDWTASYEKMNINTKTIYKK
jgi:hypothetical protein